MSGPHCRLKFWPNSQVFGDLVVGSAGFAGWLRDRPRQRWVLVGVAEVAHV